MEGTKKYYIKTDLKGGKQKKFEALMHDIEMFVIEKRKARKELKRNINQSEPPIDCMLISITSNGECITIDTFKKTVMNRETRNNRKKGGGYVVRTK